MATRERNVKARISARDDASKVFRDFKSVLTSVGAVAAAVGAVQIGRTLVNGLARAVQEAGEFEARNRALAVALANQGSLNRRVLSDMVAYADQLERTTLLTDDQVLSAQSLALNLGAGAQKAKEAALAAANLAATGVEMDTAIEQVSKTFTGFARELGRRIPEIKALTEEQLRNGAAVDVINKKYAGFAQKMVGGFKGAVIQNEKALDNLAKTIGGPVRDAITILLTQVITPLILDLDDAVAGTDLWRVAVGRAGLAILGWAETMVGLVALMEKVKNKSAEVVEAFAAFQGIDLKGDELKELLKSIAAGVIQTTQLGRAMNQTANLLSVVTKEAEQAKEELKGSDTEMGKILERLEAAKKEMQSLVDGTRDVAEGITNIPKAAKTSFDLLEERLRSLGITADVELREKAEAVVEAFKLLAPALEEGTDPARVASLRNELRDLARQLLEKGGAVDGLDQVAGFDDKFGTLDRALQDLGITVGSDLKQETDRVTEAFELLFAAMQAGLDPRRAEALFEKLTKMEEQLSQEGGVREGFEGIVALQGQILSAQEAINLVIAEGADALRLKIELSGKEVQTLGDELRTALQDQAVASALQLGDTLVDAFLGAKVSARELFRQILADFARAIIRALILRAILLAFGGGGGGASAAAGHRAFALSAGTAQKGMLVPGVDLGGDRVPILARPGELVVDRETTQELLEAVRGGTAGGKLEVHVHFPHLVGGGPGLPDAVAVAVARAVERVHRNGLVRRR